MNGQSLPPASPTTDGEREIDRQRDAGTGLHAWPISRIPWSTANAIEYLIYYSQVCLSLSPPFSLSHTNYYVCMPHNVGGGGLDGKTESWNRKYKYSLYNRFAVRSRGHFITITDGDQLVLPIFANVQTVGRSVGPIWVPCYYSNAPINDFRSIGWLVLWEHAG